MGSLKVDPIFGKCPPRFRQAFEGYRGTVERKCGITESFPVDEAVVKRNTASIKRELKASFDRKIAGSFFSGDFGQLPCEDKNRYIKWLPNDKFSSSHLALCADFFINFDGLSVEWDRVVAVPGTDVK